MPIGHLKIGRSFVSRPVAADAIAGLLAQQWQIDGAARKRA